MFGPVFCFRPFLFINSNWVSSKKRKSSSYQPHGQPLLASNRYYITISSLCASVGLPWTGLSLREIDSLAVCAYIHMYAHVGFRHNFMASLFSFFFPFSFLFSNHHCVQSHAFPYCLARLNLAFGVGSTYTTINLNMLMMQMWSPRRDCREPDGCKAITI